MAKTHWKNLANYDYLGAYSLEGLASNELILTIANVKPEKVTGDNGRVDNCIVAYFEEKQKDGVLVKPMILNKTNCNIISNLYNTGFIEDWVGKKIAIYATETKMARDIVPCLRIKSQVPVEETYICEQCGTVVDKKTALGIKEKYGAVLCSKECLEKYNESKGE